MRPIHRRMPVIIPRDQEPMEAHEVSTTVNAPANDSPGLIEPLPTPATGFRQ